MHPAPVRCARPHAGGGMKAARRLPTRDASSRPTARAPRARGAPGNSPASRAATSPASPSRAPPRGAARADRSADLLLAAEPVRHGERARMRAAHRGEQHALARRDRHRDLVPLVPERSRHAAAPRGEPLPVEAGARQDLGLGVEPQDRLVTAVPVHDRAAARPRRLIAALPRQELAASRLAPSARARRGLDHLSRLARRDLP